MLTFIGCLDRPHVAFTRNLLDRGEKMFRIDKDFQPEPIQRSQVYKMKRLYHRTWGPKVLRLVDTYYEPQLAMQYLLEANPNVKTYCEQFPKIDEYVNGKRLRHIFSFWVRYWNRVEELVQVVHKRQLVTNQRGELEPKRWADICQWSATQGYKCRFVVEKTGELKNRIFIDNWEQILHFIQSGMERDNNNIIERVHAAVSSREVLRISDLPRVFPMEHPDELNETLLMLLHRGKVKIDLSRHLLNESFPVEPANEITRTD